MSEPNDSHESAGQVELAASFAPYEIARVLGEGGMGVVYLARHARLDRLVALKLLSPERSGELAPRFEREARTMARLNHPNIVGFYDSGRTSNGRLYLVMEYIEGATLAELIANPPPDFDPRAIAMQVCDALAYAHGEGVVHRDIKPGNVLVDARGRVKVADFGLARLIDADDSATLTAAGKVMGTPGYMAPEQLRGETMDQRTDLFALGALIYEMLCGERAEGVFDPPSKRAGCDPRWDAIVSRAMQPEPAARYASAVEMRAAIEALNVSRARAGRVKVVRTVAVCALLAMCGWFAWDRWPASPAVTASRFPNAATPLAERGADSPAQATRDTPFINSLDMKFVPVPTGGKRVLFSVWETRVQDFDRFIEHQTKHQWKRPTFIQEITHPVVAVSWDAIQDFCTWLTEVDRKAGRIGARDRYRIPTDHEWSCAVGLGGREDAAKPPAEKHALAPEVYPWGSAWIDGPLPGDYAGLELRQIIDSGQYPSLKNVLPGHRDSMSETTVAATFPANEFGLFDLGGNAWELCDDWLDAAKTKQVLRGGSWASANRQQLLSNYRGTPGADAMASEIGFRCVLELAE